MISLTSSIIVPSGPLGPPGTIAPLGGIELPLPDEEDIEEEELKELTSLSSLPLSFSEDVVMVPSENLKVNLKARLPLQLRIYK